MAFMSAAVSLRLFPFRSSLRQKGTYQDRDRDTGHPEQSAFAEMSDVVVRGGDAFAESIGKQWSNQCGNAERQEVDPACSAAFNLVGIDFFDDGVRNHRRAGEDSEKQAAYHCGFVSFGEADER